MKILGALLAGGKAKRFGSDKAMAVWNGQCLIDHALDLLKPQCDSIIICGRQYKDYDHIIDRPKDAGPLGAINAALLYAQNHGYDAVISFPCDTIKGDTIKGDVIVESNNALQYDSLHNLSWFSGEITPQYIRDQPVIGFWPSSCAGLLDQWLASQDRRAMMAWTEHCGADAIEVRYDFININEPSDLFEINR